jgi:hypothetical protein
MPIRPTVKNQEKRNHPDLDMVMTPPELARQIVDFLEPSGRILDPCRGKGAFYNAFPKGSEKFWCEKLKGKDFFEWTEKVDWIISNPPWSLIREFIIHAFTCADHVAFLCTIEHTWMIARIRDMHAAGFGIKDIIVVESPFPGGKLLGMVHYQRGYVDFPVGLYWPWNLGPCNEDTPARIQWLEKSIRNNRRLTKENRRHILANLENYKNSPDYIEHARKRAKELAETQDAVKGLAGLSGDQLLKRRLPMGKRSTFNLAKP